VGEGLGRKGQNREHLDFHWAWRELEAEKARLETLAQTANGSVGLTMSPGPRGLLCPSNQFHLNVVYLHGLDIAKTAANHPNRDRPLDAFLAPPSATHFHQGLGVERVKKLSSIKGLASAYSLQPRQVYHQSLRVVVARENLGRDGNVGEW
jgi:hypothetical protein